MNRLTSILRFPLDTFKRCQLCGYTSTYDDICEFRMWTECDDNDIPEAGNVLILCTKECKQILDKHPRLYVEVPWGAGGPGMFMLLCGDCKFRDKSSCKNSELKSNGGVGLEIKFARPLPLVHLSFADGKGGWLGNRLPASTCVGYEKKEIDNG